MKIDLKKFSHLVQLFAPAILQQVGVPAALTGLVMHGIIVAQGMPGATGAAKKASVQDLVKTGGAVADMAVHPGVNDLDEDQLAATVGVGIDAVIEVVNTVHNIPAAKAVPK